MAKDDERERQLATVPAAERRATAKGRRFSSGEVADLITALFALTGHHDGLEVPPPLLAHALAVQARICGAWSTAVDSSIDEELDNDGP